ncbi:hypothetical protein GUJ93_ZPchr0004g40051 [Zizania palustris]|uniref:TF-B3 domain-containing protein n=1 Tax=Zizania palustris TaxID=103762 RepID=A0A8J5SLM2_ZIZPA|nr:hypothetical protein GUJ93_ZPchr0004g40051 [Zizania palustris]
MAAAAAALPIDRRVWMACAVPLSRIPAVGDQVFYFPYGHAEQCRDPLPDPLPDRHVFPCAVTAVHLAVDAVTDEPYATISLVPGTHYDDQPHPPAPAPAPAPAPDFSYYAKQLTQSDSNNGGGFSVPRYCADNILPGLNFSDDPPLQNLRMKDLQGDDWEFRHIYRGTPRRHLLTTGWSKFVNAKMLVAGDTVVFMRRPDADNENEKELLVGVRRAARYGAYPLRNVRARVPVDEVVEAVRLAASGAEFTVTYYPRHGAGEFVVPRKVVEDGLSCDFKPGMHVKMQVMEADDTNRHSTAAWATGIINDVDQNIWRMLEVEWDVSPASSSTLNKHVNCWQVKRARIPRSLNELENSEDTSSAEGAADTVPAAPLPVQHVPAMTPLLAWQLPPAMQGARHNVACSSSTALSTSQASLTLNLEVSVPASSSDTVDGSSPNDSVNIPPSDLPNKTGSIQLFGTIITPYVQSATSSASEQVTQGIDDEADKQDDTCATNTLDLLGIGDNLNGASEGARSHTHAHNPVLSATL